MLVLPTRSALVKAFSHVFPALFVLNMLIGTGGGQPYSEQELRDMLEGGHGHGHEKRGRHCSILLISSRNFVMVR